LLIVYFSKNIFGMNALDIIILVPILWGVYKGFRKGLIIELTSLIALWLGVYSGIHFSNLLAAFLQKNYSLHSVYLPIIAFAILFLGIIALLFLIAKLTERFLKLILLNWLNRLLGAIFGGLKFALLISVLFFIFSRVEQKFGIIPLNAKTNSVLYQPISKLAPAIIPILKSIKIAR